MTSMCIAAANYIVELTNNYNKGKPYSERIPMTCKRLQKLLYFSDIEYMKMTDGSSMFHDDFYAWPSGPVIPSVYDKFMQYQTGEMIPVGGEHTPIDDQMKTAIEVVFEKTTNIDTYDLVEQSHVSNGPWELVYSSDDINHHQIISKKEMLRFYRERNTIDTP